MDLSHVDKICEAHGNRADQLIGILQDVQAQYRYLPKHPLERVSECLNIPIAQVFSVATFFSAFSLEPRGKNIVHVCMGTACHVRGAKRLLEEIERGFDIAAGQTTKDANVTLETVNCVGACALGPVIVVNEEYHGRMDGTKTSKLIETIKGSKK
ncbi:MAG: NAD(P)H-dependent oxidoreductase subunit E [bacterium]